MKNPVCWFEIHVDDLPRAKAFYEGVFQQPLGDGDCSASDDFAIVHFSTNYEQYGISGMLYNDKNTPIVRGNNVTVYFNCDDCSVEAARAEQFGGKLLQAKTSIGKEGFYAIIEDTEGNRIGLHSMQ